MLRDNKYKIENAILGFVLSLIVVGFVEIGLFSPLVSLLRYATAGVQVYFYDRGQELTEYVNSISNVASVISNSDNIRLQNIELLSQVSSLKTANNELSEKLSEQGQFKSVDKLVAHIRYLSENMSEIYIDVGGNHGVKVGQIVVVSNIPIGEITEVDQYYSKVKLINSSDVKIPAKIIETNLNIIVQYDSELGLVIRDIPQTKTITKGNTIVATGINSNYINGLLIGQVGDFIGSSTAASRTVRVEYPIQVNNLTDVFVLLSEPIETNI